MAIILGVKHHIFSKQCYFTKIAGMNSDCYLISSRTLVWDKRPSLGPNEASSLAIYQPTTISRQRSFILGSINLGPFMVHFIKYPATAGYFLHQTGPLGPSWAHH
jgi:hypothetical protein